MPSRASLIRHIAALEREIDCINRFHSLPVKVLSPDQAVQIRDRLDFVGIEQLAYRASFAKHDIGVDARVRYQLRPR